VTPGPRGRTLRARLALLYAGSFTGSGVVLLIIADLPLLTFSHAHRAPGAGLAGAHAGVRSGTNLPAVLAYSGIALAILVPVSIALGWLVADRAVRPLRTITSAARAISARNLDERLSPGPSYAEFTELGAALDDLFARLSAAFESQRHFVANASHELRTPLAAERTLIQVALADPDASAESLRSTCRQLLALCDQQDRLISALLTLAVSQRGLARRERFDLAEITGMALRERGGEAAARGLRLTASLAEAPADGDPSLAGSLVANLVDNALRHNVRGGQLDISTGTGPGTGATAARLSISNTGIVIPPGDVERLFQPFQQLGRERVRGSSESGHGLGLAIASAIATAHGAALTAAARPGGGLDITVTFPPPSARAAGQDGTGR
jgi:signal transduction histidine kinase